MPDFILDDVNELLLKDIGDPKILTRIQRAAERGEVISIYERQYVQNLVDTQLRKKSESSTPKKETPKVKQPSISEQKQISERSILQQSEKKQIFASKTSNQKKKKIAFGVGAIAIAVVLVIGISQSGITEFNSEEKTIQPQTKTTGFVLETDASSYSKGDIISISGSSNPPSDGVVNLSIKNPKGDTVWAENVKLKSNNSYSTLTIAGGAGWESGGKYILTGSNGDLRKETSLNFKN